MTELSEYLRIQDPTLKGYSRRNLYNMVAFYEAYSSPKFSELGQKLLGDKIKQIQNAQIVQMPSAQLPAEPSKNCAVQNCTISILRKRTKEE